VERLYREVRAYAIPAGSEEIMLDRQHARTQRALESFDEHCDAYARANAHLSLLLSCSSSLCAVGVRMALKTAAKNFKSKM
jgi:hypothetical protein